MHRSWYSRSRIQVVNTKWIQCQFTERKKEKRKGRKSHSSHRMNMFEAYELGFKSTSKYSTCIFIFFSADACQLHYQHNHYHKAIHLHLHHFTAHLPGTEFQNLCKSVNVEKMWPAFKSANSKGDKKVEVWFLNSVF